MKKVIALLLVLVLAFGLTACAQKASTTAEEPVNAEETADDGKLTFYEHPSDYQGELPLVQDGQKHTITIGLRTSAEVLDYDNNDYTLWLEEMTGIDIEFVPFTGSAKDARTQISLMMAGGEKLPDIIMNCGISKAQAKEYGQDGYFVDLAPYLDSEAYYMHEAAATYYTGDAYDEFVKLVYDTVTDPAENAIYLYPTVYNNPADNLLAQLWINQDWLDKLGLEAPTNIEELYDVLVAFRDGDPNGNGKKDEIPMMGRTERNDANILQYVINAFIYNNDKCKFAVENGHVVSVQDQPEYREAMIYLNKLVSEGLLSPLTWTQSNTEMNALINPADGVFTCGIFACPAEKIFEEGLGVEQAYSPLRPLEAATPRGGYAPVNPDLVGYTTHITTDCEDPLLAFRLLDFMSGKESSLRQRWGVPGRDWEYYDDPTGNSGMFGGEARIKLINANVRNEANSVHWHYENGLLSDAYFQQVVDVNDGSFIGTMYKKIQEQIKNYEEVGQPEQAIYSFLRNAEEDEIFNDYNTDVSDYWKDARAKFCTGVWDPSDDAQWQSYLDDLKSMGFYENWLAIAQSVWDREHY